jgi:hypothetical protein
MSSLMAEKSVALNAITVDSFAKNDKLAIKGEKTSLWA